MSLLFVSAQFPYWAAGTLVLSALAGASLGFLRHNLHPSRIILGDAGAYFLGYTLAATALLGNLKLTTFLGLLPPALFLLLPILDTTQVVVRRLLRGQNPLSTPGKDHIHHRLLARGLSQRRVAFLLWGAALLFNLLAMVYLGMPWEAILTSLLATALGLAWVTYRRLRALWRGNETRGPRLRHAARGHQDGPRVPGPQGDPGPEAPRPPHGPAPGATAAGLKPLRDPRGPKPGRDAGAPGPPRPRGPHPPQAARALKEMGADYVLVHGDTLTTFAVAWAAFLEGIPVGHVEAGLRSGNLKEPFPEEANRRLTDVLTDLDFAPTPSPRRTSLRRGSGRRGSWSRARPGWTRCSSPRSSVGFPRGCPKGPT